MRRASLAPGPAGGDADAGAAGTSHGGGGGVSRLQMPQVMTVLTRPPIPGPSEDSGSVTAAPEAHRARIESDGDDDSTVPETRTPPVSPPTARARKEGSVQVAVRVRPLLPKEVATRVRTCVESEGNKIFIPSSDKTFVFDHVFPMEASQTDLYMQVVHPLMDSFLQGYNVTVLAYGQTGSGKTYTMGNDSSIAGPVPSVFQRGKVELDAGVNDIPEMQDHEGVIPRFINELFARLARDRESSTDQVSVSFLEIYGEEIHDLLDQFRGQSRDNLQIRENNGSVWVQGLTEVKVSNYAEAGEQMRQGCLRRITGSTGMNERSSRSHAVYTVKLVRKMKKSSSADGCSASKSSTMPPFKRRGSRKLDTFSSEKTGSDPHDDDSETTIISKLTFVDLAGSERLKKTQAEGDRMKEGIQINVGLLALGNVITALGDERRRSNPRQHVAYRDSKLTRLLQDALGGNSRTLFIACVSPAESSGGETVNTLQYASRAKNIQNKAIKNVDPRSAELARSKVLNDVLRSALTRACSLVTGDMDARHVDISTLMIDQIVIDFLNKLEEIAWSVASGAISSAEATSEVAKAMSAIAARRQIVYPGNFSSGNSAASSPSKPTDTASASGSAVSIMDMTTSESGSSIHLFGLEEPRTLTSIEDVARVLQVIGLSLEIEELKGQLAAVQTDYSAMKTEQDSRLSQKRALICANEDALQKMSSWEIEEPNSCSGVDRREHYAQISARLESTKMETESISSELELETIRFNQQSEMIRLQIRTKQQKVQDLRKSGSGSSTSDTATNPLDLLLQVTELKHRFGLNELYDVAWALQDEEKEWCEVLDEPHTLAFPSKFFSGEPSGLCQHLFGQIQKAIEKAIVDEDLHTSQSKKLRERARIAERLAIGWLRDSKSMSQEEFVSTNGEQFRSCQEHIREIAEVLRYRRHSSSMLTYIIDGIDSLDLARNLIKRFVDALYAYERITRSRLHGRDMAKECSSRVFTSDPASEVKKYYEQKLKDMEAKFSQDLAGAYDSVRPFSFDSLDSERESHAARRQSDAKKIALLEEQARFDKAAMTKMKGELESLHRNFDSIKSQFGQLRELAVIREECEQLARELGLDVEDFAGVVAVVNPAAMAQAREVHENLRVQKAKKMEQIEIAWGRVNKLEALLGIHEPLSFDLQSNHPERRLNDHLLAIEIRYKERSDEIARRIESQLRVLNSIKGLVIDIEVVSAEELRHSRDLSQADFDGATKMVSTISTWRQVQDSPDLAIAIAEVLPSDGAVSEILSDLALERNRRVRDALLSEKTARVAEVEKVAAEVRALVELMEFTEIDMHSTLRQIEDKNSDTDPAPVRELADDLHEILRKEGQVDTSLFALKRLQVVCDALVQVRNARSNALTFLHSILDEAEKVAQESLISSGFHDSFGTPSSSGNQDDSKANECSRESLRAGSERLMNISDCTERAIHALLFSLNDQLLAYGIESDSQRLSFFLGSEDTIDNPNRKLLEKFLSAANEESASSGSSRLYPDCLLSTLDPAYGDFAWYFSRDYVSERISELKESVNDIRIINGIVVSAQNRLKSLHKIMTDFNAVNAIEKAMAAFDARAKDKSRLFGSSTVLMKEEKERKRFAREYPLKIASLKKEVDKWVQNECGEYDLDILGEEMKRMILNMLKQDTNLMHLDLRVINPSRPSARRASKTAAGIAVGNACFTPTPSTNHTNHPNQDSSAPVVAHRARPGSALTRDGNGKKRGGE